MRIQIRFKDNNAVWCSPMGEPGFHDALRALGHDVVDSGADVVYMDSQLEIGDEPTVIFCWRDCAEPPAYIEGTETGRYDDRDNVLGYVCPTLGTDTITGRMWGDVIKTAKPVTYLTTMPWERIAHLGWPHLYSSTRKYDVGFVGLVDHSVELYREHRRRFEQAWSRLEHMGRASVMYSTLQYPLTRFQQWEVLRQCKVIVCPWGITELCWRDYEAVLAGSMIVKPQQNISASLNPWDDENTVYCKPDYSDLQEKCREAINLWDGRRKHLLAKREDFLAKASDYEELASEFVSVLEGMLGERKQAKAEPRKFEFEEHTQQSWEAKFTWGAFKNLYGDDVGHIYEIGSGSGKWAHIISQILECPVESFDVNPVQYPPTELVAYHQLDVFKHVNLIARGFGSDTLLLCDGGLKEEEFRTFAPLLPKGAFIACHDYFDSLEDFYRAQEEGIWDWIECNGENIDTTGFKRIMPETMRLSAWGVWRKE